MAIVGAFCCSHGALMVTRESKAPARQRDAIYGAFEEMGAHIMALEPDAICILGTDHGRIYGWDLVPAFVLGVGDVAHGIGDAGLDEVEWPMHAGLTRAVLDEALARGIDLAYSERMKIDHSFVTPLLLAKLDASLPLVPMMQNCNAPPIPTPQRSYQVGEAVGAALRESDARVVMLGTGGLSHWVGGIERRSWLRRPAGQRWQASVPMDLGDTGPINQDFDKEFLDAICSGRLEGFLEAWPEDRIEEEAGNGAQEIRNWVFVAGALGNRGGTVISYEPVGEWLTGSAIVSLDATSTVGVGEPA